jgi:CRISPR system Cascade subunit CasE
VQSVLEPRWDYAFLNARYLLAAPPEVKAFDPSFSTEQFLRFRLCANPAKRLMTKPNGKSVGPRVGLHREDEQRAWLDRKASASGFRIVSCEVVPEGRPVGEKTEDGNHKKMPWLAVRFEGMLQVTQPELLQRAIRRGVGSAKAFGFGMLSLAPVR